MLFKLVIFAAAKLLATDVYICPAKLELEDFFYWWKSLNLHVSSICCVNSISFRPELCRFFHGNSTCKKKCPIVCSLEKVSSAAASSSSRSGKQKQDFLGVLFPSLTDKKDECWEMQKGVRHGLRKSEQIQGKKCW